MAHDVGDEVLVKKRKSALALQEERERSELLAVLETRAGLAVIRRIMARCGLFRDPFNTDAGFMAFQVGQQNVGRWLLSEVLTASPKAGLLVLDAERNRDGNEAA